MVISPPLDEYYRGESIPSMVSSASSAGQIKVALLSGEWSVTEGAGTAGSSPLAGTFPGCQLQPGIYTLRATLTAPQQAPLSAQRPVSVAPDPFGWSHKEKGSS